MTPHKPTAGTDDAGDLLAAIEPPAHLSDEAKELYREIEGGCFLSISGYKILRLACETYDRAQTARAYLAEHGQTFTDRFSQPKPRPEVKIAHDASALCSKLLQDLLRFVTAPADSFNPLAALEQEHGDPLDQLLARRNKPEQPQPELQPPSPVMRRAREQLAEKEKREKLAERQAQRDNLKGADDE